MGMRAPPSDGVDEDVGTVEFGIAELDARLDDADLQFPADAATVVEALGDPEVSYDARGNAVALSRVLEDVDRDHFEHRRDLLNAVHPVFEDRRTASATGLVDWVRSLFDR